MNRSAKLALAVALVLPLPAEAGLFRRCHRPRPRPCPPRCATPAVGVAYPVAPVSATLQAAAWAPPSGNFLGWLNATRARYGLGPVAWDSGLAADAAANSSYGFNHNLMGRARRQNVGVGDLAAVSAMWLSSPAHASALLDPSVTRMGLANVGGVWTANLN